MSYGALGLVEVVGSCNAVVVLDQMLKTSDVEFRTWHTKCGGHALDKSTKAYELYGEETIHERHRHRYEVNNYYREDLLKAGMTFSGLSPDGRIVEMLELPDHPWFIATQAHPEFKSRPNRPHPLFKGFIGAALEYQDK